MLYHSMARRGIKIRRVEIEDPSVDLTPLIDVVFSILIMFMVVAPLLELDRVQLADASSQPQEDSISIQDVGNISIHVHQDNTIWLNKKMVDAIHLPELLKQEKKRYPDARPQVFHDRRAQFGVYQSVKNAAEVAGFDQLDIILKPA